MRSTPGTEEEAAPGAVEIEEEDEDLGEDDDDYYMVRCACMWRKKESTQVHASSDAHALLIHLSQNEHFDDDEGYEDDFEYGGGDDAIY